MNVKLLARHLKKCGVKVLNGYIPRAEQDKAIGLATGWLNKDIQIVQSASNTTLYEFLRALGKQVVSLHLEKHGSRYEFTGENHVGTLHHIPFEGEAELAEKTVYLLFQIDQDYGLDEPSLERVAAGFASDIKKVPFVKSCKVTRVELDEDGQLFTVEARLK